MATKRSWKLQEFVAHSSNVNCLALGPKSGHVLVTGGEDKKVNMWAVGKPNCIMSFSGQTSAVECVRFNSDEELLAAGSQSGTLKIWDLEAAKIVRTLTGHKSNVKGLDFHPYGDFVASSSSDTKVKLWDIRRKGCIYTYTGHSGPVECIQFSPDGRWLLTGGDDCVIKLWDLAMGKLLHEFKGHNGAISGIEFHPVEFLMASGSKDKTVKFWDLETFNMVSSTAPGASPIRSITFHPEGNNLFCGSTDYLHVFGWEPVRCFDAFPMSWGKVEDMVVSNSQLIGASCHQTNVSIYVVDINKINTSENNVQYMSPTKEEPGFNEVPRAASARRSFRRERPHTTSTKPKPEVKSEPQRQSPTEDDEREDLNSSAEIRDPVKYEEIFQPKHKLGQPPEKPSTPFPAPLEDKAAGPKEAPVPKKEPSTPQESVPVKPPQPEAALPHQHDVQHNQQAADVAPVRGRAETSREKIEGIRKGHGSVCSLLMHRNRNLDVIRAIWTAGDIKTAVESAINMRDQAVVVDLLNILNLRKTLWTLGLCVILLPTLKDLLTSKYENYVMSACSSLKLLLISFTSLINNSIKIQPTGVDFSREERYKKCSKCYSYLIATRGIVEERQHLMGKLGSTFRELQLLLNQLE
ncbi:katanin p80 WD40 repeat-containing subunit B1-like isoform X2 [Apostichopus japonicus]|uniref:katanin p80 WD40 repeat-containing subunit B1-like isoform X2 n=1 Tax=Stichopus japonicus TaxID=307972 RepID=UPI003AB65110